MDQALFAGSNFLLNILLARWLSPHDYGAFAVAYTIFLLLGTLHTALLTEPMLVFGSGKYKDRLVGYLALALQSHWYLTAGIGLLLGVTGLGLLLLGEKTFGPLLLALGLASPFLLFQWIMRRACYVRLEPRPAAYAGMLYLVFLLVSSYFLYTFNLLNALSALAAMAIASLLSALWLLWTMESGSTPAYNSALGQESLQDHWRYGRWALGIGFLAWVPGNVYYFLLTFFHSLESAGALRALFNLLMPIWHINTALAGVLIPVLVTLRKKGRLVSGLGWATAFFAALAGVYSIMILTNPDAVISFLYGSRYSVYSPLLWPLTLLLIPSAITATLGAGLRALEKPKYVFAAWSVDTVSAVTQGVLLTALWGIRGAVISIGINSLLSAGMMVWLTRRAMRGERL